MTVAATAYPLLGSQPVGNYFTPDTTQRTTLGNILSVNDPYWGGGEFIYLKAGSTIFPGSAVTWDSTNTTILVPNTANLGVPVALAQTAMTTGTFGWFQIAGQALAFSNATVAVAAPIGIAAAGQLGANTAGKEILNARVAVAATTTVVKTNCVTKGNSNVVLVSNADGWFIGMPVSGTGIPASSSVTSIGSDNRTVTLNNSATSSAAVTLTGTYNDGTNFWNVVTIDRPFAQGAIT